MKGQAVTDKELGSLIQWELSNSDNRQGSEAQTNSETAYDYMLYRQKGDEVEGRSQIQSGDVADMVDSVQAEIQPMLDVDQLVEIQPEGADDVERAELETKALNWYWRERCRGFEKLDDALQDGLLLRNAYLKIWYEDGYKLPYEETLQGTPMQVDAELVQLGNQGEVRVQSETVVQEAQIATIESLDVDGVTPIYADVEMAPALVEVQVLIIPRRREILMEAVPREDMFISRDASTQNLQEPKFVAQRRWMTRNEAIALGFSQDDIWSIPPDDFIATQTKTARRSDTNRLRSKGSHDGGDGISIYEVYFLVDMDGDGIAERHKVFYANRKVLRWEETGEYANEIVRLVPFASGVPLKVSHRHAGRSLFDKERAVEDYKRSLLRQGLDNIELANNRRPLIGPGVNPDDVEETEIGAYIRCTKGIAEYGETQYTPMFSETLMGLEYMDKMRRERGGSAIETAGPGFLPGNAAAHTTERMMSATEQLAAMMARNLANTLIRDGFVILHQQLKLAGEPLNFQDGDTWQSVEPRSWMDRERFTVKLGLSQGEKYRRANAYEGHFMKQLQLQQVGKDGVLVDDSNIYETVTAQANTQGLADTTQLYTDPQSEQAQLARIQKANAVRQEQEMMAAQQQMMLQAQMQVVTMQEETKRLSDAMEQQSKHLDRLNKYVIEMTKLEAQTNKDIEGGVLIGDGEVVQ